MEIFMELFESIQRQGPGSEQSTCRALAFCEDLSETANILDVGCGSGMQSVVLAKETGGRVTAIDTHQPFLAMAMKNAEQAGLSEQIYCLNQDMNNLNFQDQTFDLIWSEGAIYLMGFDNGFRVLKPLLRKGGILAVTELSWFSDARPEEAVLFWQEGYPQLRSVEENLAAIHKAGFEPLAHFNLPETDWTDLFYKEIEEQLLEIERKYPIVPEAKTVIDSNRMEIELFRKYRGSYGYTFYISKVV